MLNAIHHRSRSYACRFSRRGNATIELVLTMSILLGLTFGSIEFGYFFFVKNTVQGAAREAARMAVIAGSTNAEVTTAANNSLSAAGMVPANFTVRIRNSADTADVNVATVPAGDGIRVTVSGTWETVGVRPLGLIGSSKIVLGGATMRKESL